MESPVKQPTFVLSEDKENAIASDEIAVPVKGIPMMDEPVKAEAPSTASTIKKEEAIEPLLQENPHRFVLFPIKYHEVRVDHHERVTKPIN